MALIHMDGFDGYSSAADLYALQYTGSGMGLSTNGGRYGGGAITMNGGGQMINIAGSLPTELYLGFALKFDDISNNDRIIACFFSQWNCEASLTYNPNLGSFRFWKGQSNNYLGAGTAGMSPGVWHWIDIRFKYDTGSGGAFELWVDGALVGSMTGVSTSFSSQSISHLTAASVGNTAIGTLTNCYIDDVVLCDTTGSVNNGRIGDHKIETLVPTSDAGPNNGTPSTGTSHYALVDDATWDGSDYVTITNTSGQEELFGFADLATTPASIMGVRVVHYSQKTDTGDASLETVVVSSGTESDGASQPLGTSWARYGTILENDPHTAAAWTGAAVNAMQAGVKVP